MAHEDGPGRMADFLAETALFAGLGDRARREVAAQLQPRRLERGETLWSEGEDAQDLVVVVDGQLEVVTAGSDGGDVLARLGPGDCAGEMALLLGEPRTATVRCARAAAVLVLDAVDFQRVVNDNPAVLAHLTRLLARRLADRSRPREQVRTIGVVARDGVPGASLVARAIAALLPHPEGTRPLLVRVGSTGPTISEATKPGSRHLEGVRARRARVLDLQLGDLDPIDLPKALGILDTAADRYGAVVIDWPAGTSVTADVLAKACDVVVEVTGSPEEPSPPSADGGARRIVVCNPLDRNDARPPVTQVEPFVLPAVAALRGAGARDQLAHLRDAPTSALVRVLGRLARSIAGVTVGVALGGGAAFGIAHVGVLAALEDAGIPVDLVAGTSMGSIVAIGHATGMSAAEMTDVAGRIGDVRTTLSALDPSASGAGMLSGRRLVKIFEPFLRVRTFEELEVPCRVVATDIERGECVEIASGTLTDAFRASCSIPLVFVPVRVGGRTLVDGAMVDPVPARVARGMGADVVIAVNVVPRPDPDGRVARPRGSGRLLRPFPLGRRRDPGLPDLLDVLMSSLQVVQYELGSFTSTDADVNIDVDLAGFTWIEFYRALDIIERGRVAGRAHVDAIRTAIADRLDDPGRRQVTASW